MSTSLLFTLSLPVSPANGQLGLYIYEITARDSFTQIQNATVGMPVTLVATIATENGTYKVYFNDKLVDTGLGQQHYVSSNFTIPEIPSGTYNFTLTDVAINQNTTYPFPILTEYSAKPTVPNPPAQIQEGTGLTLNVTITAGTPNTAVGAEITVLLPAPLSKNYTKTVSMTTSALGTAQTIVNYPDSSFSPSDSSTLYAGAYQVYFNQSQGLATNQFTVGFTDLTQYHRGDTVKIRAVGYQPSQASTLAITFNNGVIFTQSVTASDQGVVTSSWPIPSSAGIGQYTVTITPQTSPSKGVPDQQNFQILGYPINFKAVNLAGEVVSGIVISAFDSQANQTRTGTTDFSGLTTINLETGSATVSALWNQVEVSKTTITITGNATLTITCQLTDLKITVQDKNGVIIPFVSLNLTYQYVTNAGATQTGTASGITDLNGVYTFNSTLTGITYTVDASKYSKVFNAGNNTISSVPAVPVASSIVITPDESLKLTVTDYGNAAIPNARVTLIEQASGIFYSLTTDAGGSVQVTVTFGQYRASIYTASDVLLNSTVVNVISDTQSSIRCSLYKIPVTVKIVDYFGNPLSNVVVQLSRTGMTTIEATTKGDGTVTFNDVIGGSMEVLAYPNGNQNAFVAKNQQVNSPTTITVNMNKFVAFGGSLIDTSTLAAIVLVILAIVLLIIVEVVRRIRFRFSHRPES
jgi:hypothetical protein